ncbi:DUF4268 domain-containing protein [Nostoc sp. DSM 114167]|jgi:CBS domain-containing protein|uniref:DUF4268 domain-containing protein n=1 Tax=Nostoc sp. DSM 114167 TaxID=3439050 RepID=UPI0040455242
MPFTVRNLSESLQQKLVVIEINDPVQKALELMIENDFTQLPVIDSDKKLLGMITSDSILRALNIFGVTTDKLQVSHALVNRIKTCVLEDDLFEVLDYLKSTNSVVICNVQKQACGIITTYDTTEYFRKNAVDIMLIEEIESQIKDHIITVFTNNEGEIEQELLTAAIEEISESQDVYKKFENALNHYTNLQKPKKVDSQEVIEKIVNRFFSICNPTQASDKNDSEQAEGIDLESLNNRINISREEIEEIFQGIQRQFQSYQIFETQITFDSKEAIKTVVAKHFPIKKATKLFEELTFWEYTHLLFHKSRDQTTNAIYGLDSKEIFKLLNDVNNIRNTVFHFRNEISLKQRHQLQFCAAWLARHHPATPIMEQKSNDADQPLIPQASESYDTISAIITQPNFSADELMNQSDGRYAFLARQLQDKSSGEDRVTYSFENIEEIIRNKLPETARQYRLWWENDTSQPWVRVGWYVSNINLPEKTVTFIRREDGSEYITFFNALLRRLREVAPFRVWNTFQDGRHYITVTKLPKEGNTVANLAFSFINSSNQFRIELFIDKGDESRNKYIYDSILKHKIEIESEMGETLNWERKGESLASRIALYHQGSIKNSSEELENLRQWAVEAMTKFYKVMEEKVTEVLKKENL